MARVQTGKPALGGIRGRGEFTAPGHRSSLSRQIHAATRTDPVRIHSAGISSGNIGVRNNKTAMIPKLEGEWMGVGGGESMQETGERCELRKCCVSNCITSEVVCFCG